MTAPATTRRAGPFNGNDSATSFPFTFKVFSKTDVQVQLTDTGSVVSTLVQDSDYSVSVNADQDASPGGTITYPISGAPLATGEKLVVLGATTYDQPTDLPEGGAYRAKVVENALDRITFLIQQLVELSQRSLVLPASAASADTTLPVPLANKLIGWNATATALVNLDAASLATIVAFGTANADQFTGDGATKNFTLTANPGALANLDVALGGVTQLPTTDYTWSGTTLSFAVAPSNGVKILARYFQALPQGTTDSAASTFAAGLTGAVTRSSQSKMQDSVSVFDFMTAAQIADVRANTATIDTASAIQTAINYCAPRSIALLFPSGTYMVTPATAQAGAASYNTALVMQSGMHIIGQRGATIKVANNYSTDASAKELAIFSTVAHIGDVTFEGITFDLNGANNKISPSRPTTYAQFNHSAILVNGPTGYMDDVVIKDCVFKNTAGVCFIVAQLVAAGTTPPLGHRWKILNNLFLNGGLDTNDHTSVYAWCEDVVCEGNTFWQDSPPHTVGKTGGATCYEIHGSNQRFINNYCYNYTLGAYVAPNFTNTTLNSVIQGNSFYCSDFGVLLWRGVSIGYLSVDGVLIQGNTFYFDNYTYTGQSTYKSAVAYQGQIATAQGAISNVKISGNYAIATGTTLLSQFVRWDTSTTASQTGSNLSITDNQVIGFTDGVYLVTNSANGIGLTEISRNQFINGTPDGLSNPPHGIYILSHATGLIKTLVIDNNQFIDERNTPLMNTGIYLAGGTITDLALGPQVFKGMTAANCYNAGPATITRQSGIATTEGASTVGDGGTITFNADFVGFVPKAIKVTGSVAGEIVSVTAVGVSAFTVAIKKWTTGVLTAGTPQTVYWSVRF